MAPDTNTIDAFVKLGKYLTDFCDKCYSENVEVNSELKEIVARAGHHNGWFTEDNILFSLQQWGDLLTEENLKEWLSNYTFNKNIEPKTVGIVMAGNIPLVGFHDFYVYCFRATRCWPSYLPTIKCYFPISPNIWFSRNLHSLIKSNL